MDLIEHKKGFFYHPSSIIDDGAEIGRGTRIWHWVHVSADSKIEKTAH